MYLSNAIIEDICSIIEKNDIDLVFAEESFFGNLVKKIKSRFPQIKIVTFFHDISAELYIQWMKKHNLFGKLECMISIQQEKVSQRYSDCDLVFNKRDAQLYKKYYGKEPDAIIPLATYVPEINTEEEKCSGEIKELLFVGSKYYPNIIGIRWFYEHVLPKLSDRYIINIVGRGTEFLKDEFKDPRMKVWGTVDSVDMFYRNADIIIAPLFDGGGMKCKSVEALSYGKYMIGTTESMQGLWEEMEPGLCNSKVFLCNSVSEWVEVLTKLSSVQISKFNKDIFNFFIDKYSDVAVQKNFKDVLFHL